MMMRCRRMNRGGARCLSSRSGFNAQISSIPPTSTTLEYKRPSKLKEHTERRSAWKWTPVPRCLNGGVFGFFLSFYRVSVSQPVLVHGQKVNYYLSGWLKSSLQEFTVQLGLTENSSSYSQPPRWRWWWCSTTRDGQGQSAHHSLNQKLSYLASSLHISSHLISRRKYADDLCIGKDGRTRTIPIWSEWVSELQGIMATGWCVHK